MPFKITARLSALILIELYQQRINIFNIIFDWIMKPKNGKGKKLSSNFEKETASF